MVRNDVGSRVVSGWGVCRRLRLARSEQLAKLVKSTATIALVSKTTAGGEKKKPGGPGGAALAPPGSSCH